MIFLTIVVYISGSVWSQKIEATFTEATFYKQVYHCPWSLVMQLRSKYQKFTIGLIGLSAC